MKSSPYRLPAQAQAPHDRTERGVDAAAFAAATFWTVSLVRVVGGVLRHEIFGPEATIALMVVVGIPWVALRGDRRKKA